MKDESMNFMKKTINFIIFRIFTTVNIFEISNTTL